MDINDLNWLPVSRNMMLICMFIKIFVGGKFFLDQENIIMSHVINLDMLYAKQEIALLRKQTDMNVE